MPQGEFHSLEVSSVVINREQRHRKELRGIEELATSIAIRGLIHPILVQRDSLVLIAGERRLTAVKLLGWTHIAVQFEDEIDPKALRAIELEENTRRSDLTWQEQCLAVAEYNDMHAAENPEWRHEDTAEALGISTQTVGDRIQVAKEIASGNKVVAEAPKYSTALGIVDRAASRKREASVDSVLKSIGVPAAEVRARSILNTDFIEWSKSYSGSKFNFIHCDFPYGINAGQRNQGYIHAEHGTYEDSPEVYFQLLAALCDALPRIASDSCHIVFWFSMHFYSDTIEFFRTRTSFRIDPFPLMWLKSDNKGLLPDSERGPRRLYETALFGASGDRKIVRAVSNAVAMPTDPNGHMSVKPVPMLEHFFRMLVDGSTRMLDPTCGSGGALKVAKALGAEVLGLEVNPEFAKRAEESLK